jgi:hypothetical protein
VEVNGRLHVLGTIDYFWAQTVPYIHPKCALAIRLRWEGHERQKKHKIRVQLVDADGYSIATEVCRKCPPPSPEGEDIPAVRHLIIDLETVRFESFGPYAVLVEVDGAELASLPFSIVPMSQLRPRRTV